MKMVKGLFAATVLLGATPASAAVLKINDAGILTGASGVTVAGKAYNVEFVEGTCAQVYGACTVAAFDFKTDASALLAAQALLSQVIIGRFAATPSLVFGCNSFTCDTYIPFAVPNSSEVSIAIASNRGTGRKVSGIIVEQAGFSTATDPSSNLFTNRARFTLQAAVPEPATWAMMLVGFGMIGATARYRRRNRTVLA